MAYMGIANCDCVSTQRVQRWRSPRDDGSELGVREVTKDGKRGAPGISERLLILDGESAEQRVESHGVVANTHGSAMFERNAWDCLGRKP